MVEVVKSKPLTARDLAERTGYSIRFFQDLAATGIDWARQPKGGGGRIFFDPDGFEKWWQCEGVNREAKAKEWRPSTGETAGRGAKPSATKKLSVDPSRRAMKQLLESGSTPGSKS